MPFSAAGAIQLLTRARERGRLGHAYLVSGPRDANLEEFAVRVLNLVAGARHADLKAWGEEGIPVLWPESKSRRIRIGEPGEGDGVRGMDRQIHLSAASGGHKFAVIIDADCMTEQAQNAFLKTLEEPPPGTLILLTSQRPERFLPTTLSRVIRIPLQPEPGSGKLGADEEQLAALLATFSERKQPRSLPGALAIRRAFEDILDDIHTRIEKQLEGDFDEETRFLRQHTDVTGQWVEEKEKQMLAAVEARYLQERDRLMELLLSWMGDVLRHQAGSTRLDLPDHAAATRALAQRWDAAEVNRCVREIRRLQTNLQTNVQEGLALDCAFIAAFG